MPPKSARSASTAANAMACRVCLLDATQRRGKSTYIKAREAFPDAETVYHFRVLGGGVANCLNQDLLD